MEKHWKRKGVEKVFQNRLFSVFHKRFLLRPRGEEGIFATIATSNWVNVIPVTDEGGIILIRQFRHGIEETTVEIPGGGIDSPDEKPIKAAARELLEETGYTARTWEYLGTVTPNPAILDNYCHTYLARDLGKKERSAGDAMEYIEVFEASIDDVKAMLRDGTISHALVLAAFSHFILRGYMP